MKLHEFNGIVEGIKKLDDTSKQVFFEQIQTLIADDEDVASVEALEDLVDDLIAEKQQEYALELASLLGEEIKKVFDNVEKDRTDNGYQASVIKLNNFVTQVEFMWDPYDQRAAEIYQTVIAPIAQSPYEIEAASEEIQPHYSQERLLTEVSKHFDSYFQRLAKIIQEQKEIFNEEFRLRKTGEAQEKQGRDQLKELFLQDVAEKIKQQFATIDQEIQQQPTDKAEAIKTRRLQELTDLLKSLNNLEIRPDDVYKYIHTQIEEYQPYKPANKSSGWGSVLWGVFSAPVRSMFSPRNELTPEQQHITQQFSEYFDGLVVKRQEEAKQKAEYQESKIQAETLLKQYLSLAVSFSDPKSLIQLKQTIKQIVQRLLDIDLQEISQHINQEPAINILQLANSSFLQKTSVRNDLYKFLGDVELIYNLKLEQATRTAMLVQQQLELVEQIYNQAESSDNPDWMQTVIVQLSNDIPHKVFLF